MDFRLAAWRSLAIFCAIGTSLVAYADAGTSSVECVDETQACYYSDAVCLACMTEYDTDQYVECNEDSYEAYISENIGAALACKLGSLYSCCIDASSTNDCMSNDAFVNYHLCIYSVTAASSEAGAECTTLTCSGVDGVDDPDDLGGNDDSEVLGGNGAFRADVFSVRALLGLTLGVCMFVAVSF